MSAEDGPPAGLGRWTGFLLAWVAGIAEQSYTQALAGIGLKPLQLGVLSLLLDGGPTVQARLSERLGVFKPVMVTLINELEAMGLVQRRPHPSDRRAVEVHLLGAGVERIEQAELVSERATAQFLTELTAQERQNFHELLAKLARRGTTSVPDEGTTS